MHKVDRFCLRIVIYGLLALGFWWSLYAAPDIAEAHAQISMCRAQGGEWFMTNRLVGCYKIKEIK